MFKAVVERVSIPAWSAYPWLRHGFSTRLAGVSRAYGERSLNLGWTPEDDPAAVAENRRRFADAVAANRDAPLATLRQVHGVAIHAVRGTGAAFYDERGRAIHEGDGLLSDVPGMLLGILTADCVPLVLVDTRRRAVAVLHAGWRGTAAGMAGEGVRRMQQEYGSRPEDLMAAVGPSIGVCCYTVGDEVRAAFAARFSDAAGLFDGGRLDLWKANRLQLAAAGVPEGRIAVVGECTGCALTPDSRRRYFSHRIDRGMTGRMMTLAGVATD